MKKECDQFSSKYEKSLVFVSWQVKTGVHYGQRFGSLYSKNVPFLIYFPKDLTERESALSSVLNFTAALFSMAHHF